MNSFVWAREQLQTKNANCAFALDFDLREKSQIKIEISAHCMYKLYIDGSLRSFGPARAAKGYCRLDRKALRLRAGTHRIIAIVSAYNIAAYNYVKDIPFFYCNVQTPESEYDAADFRCYDFAIRVKRVQRFSFQRGFLEQYVQESDLSEYLNNPESFGARLETVVVPDRKFLRRRVPYAKMQSVRTDAIVQSGRIGKDNGLPVWRDRAIDGVGELAEGYRLHESDECVAHTLSRLTYTKTEKRRALEAGRYSVYDFGRNISGFLGAKLTVLEDASIYLLFDEILDEKSGVIDFKRLNCTNAIKWELKAGEYALQSLEPYTLRFAQINVAAGKVKVEEINVLTVENADAFRLRFATADKALEKILAAAQNTVAQNSPDLLIDCPSRERAGWINDVYYSRHSATMFTGSYNVLHATLV